MTTMHRQGFVFRQLSFAAAGLLLAIGAGAASPLSPSPVPKPAVAIQSPGKPAVGLQFDATVNTATGAKLQVGRPATVDLAFVVPVQAEWLEISVTPTESMTLVSGADSRQRPVKGKVSHRVVVMPDAEGRHYLGVTVSLLIDGEQRLRSFAVPLPVGDSAAAARSASKGRVELNSDGEAVVITRSR